MQGREKELPGVGLKKLKKILKRSRREIQSKHHHQQQEEKDSAEVGSDESDTIISTNKCPDHCQGSFVGVSVEDNIVATRMNTNLRFYGDPYLTTTDILLGTVERPRAAGPLYSALDDLHLKLRC